MTTADKRLHRMHQSVVSLEPHIYETEYRQNSGKQNIFHQKNTQHSAEQCKKLDRDGKGALTSHRTPAFLKCFPISRFPVCCLKSRR